MIFLVLLFVLCVLSLIFLVDLWKLEENLLAAVSKKVFFKILFWYVLLLDLD